MKRTFSDLFAVPSPTWGARGEPYLWEAIRLHAIENKLPLPDSLGSLERQFESIFELLTGHSINERNLFFVEKYAHGGMSSGHIEPSGWREGGSIYELIKQNLILIERTF
jgi:hypothetical protein